MNPKTGLTFAAGLRSMVRADPDVIMVGEIRDKRDRADRRSSPRSPATSCSRTLHTNDAPMAAARLVEMGIEPFLVASGVECVVAQRLVRRLCDCKAAVELSEECWRATASTPSEGSRGLRAGRLRALQRHRLPRPARHLRGACRSPTRCAA